MTMERLSKRAKSIRDNMTESQARTVKELIGEAGFDDDETLVMATCPDARKFSSRDFLGRRVK